MNMLTVLSTFLEGLISFISPCMLPLLPVYVAYFAAGGQNRGGTWARALAFVLGFSLVFVFMGVFAGSLGAVLSAHRTVVEIACGAVVILFGLGYLGLFKLPFAGMREGVRKPESLASAFVFGVVYSVGLTPCVGAFLGAALMQAATAGGAAKGAVLLMAYSAGLGIPFVLSAMLLSRLTTAFGFIKRHYGLINPVCGALLIALGAWMAVGQFFVAPVSAATAAPAPEPVEQAMATAPAEVVIRSPAEFDAEVLGAKGAVLVDVWAEWCGPCRRLKPLVEDLAERKRGVLKVCTVNIDNVHAVAEKYGIRSIPTLLLFRDGQLVKRSVGLLTREELDDFAR